MIHSSTSKQNKKIIFTSLSILLLITTWFLLSIIIKKEYLIPYPLTVIKTLFNLIKSKNFCLIILTTVKSCLIGFTISFILSLILSIISYILTFMELLINPIINTLKAIPTISILLIVLIWLPAEISPIVVTSIILFPMMYNTFLDSLKSVDKELVEMSLIYKVSLWNKIQKLYIPSISNPLITQSKNCISLSVKLTIAAEVLAHALHSIGIQMQIAKTYLEMDVIFAWTIIAVILSYLFELTITLFSNLIIRRKTYGH